MAIATARALTGLLHDLTDEEVLALTDSGNRMSLKEFLSERILKMWYKVSYDQSIGLMPLIERAVGERNLGNINRDITRERFKLTGTGVRTVNLRVEPFLNGETGEDCAKRLVSAGHTLENIGELAGFLAEHPEEVEKCSWVLAIGENSRWSRPGEYVLVPCACVGGTDRRFDLGYFRGEFGSGCGVLVSGK